MPSATEIVRLAEERVQAQSWRVGRYRKYIDAYLGTRNQPGAVLGSYADGRPALQDIGQMKARLLDKWSPNMLKPIIDDAVAVGGVLPAITFDAAGDGDAERKQAMVASRAVRGQYEQSQMDVAQARAVFFLKLLGDNCYTLDPMSPKEAKENGNPFALPGVYINVHDPTFAYPVFGTGSEYYRIQDLYLVFDKVEYQDLCRLYPGVKGKLVKDVAGKIVMQYTKQDKYVVVAQESSAHLAYEFHHGYGFCPAEWGINKATFDHWGMSEIDQAVEGQHIAGLLYNLAIDSAIASTFPIYHFHNTEHASRLKIGPGSIVDTSEDGKFEILAPEGNTRPPIELLSMSHDNLFKLVGTAPIRVEGDIKHSNTSQRALSGAQMPMEQRFALASTLLGNTLQWLNSKIAWILYSDKEFKNTEMSVYGTDARGKRFNTSFTGADLGGLWRNHVKWTNLLGGNEHEQLVMGLQLEKDGLWSGRKVLESIGSDDPERDVSEALDWQKQKAHAAQAMQGGAPGGPPGGQSPGGPPGASAAEQGVALNAGALGGGGQPSPGPASPPPAGGGGAMISGFSPTAGAPGGPPGGATPVPDIWQMIQQAITQADDKLLTYVKQAYGTPTGIFVQVSDQRYIPILRQILKPVAEMIGGPGATAEVSIKDKPSKGSSS